MELQKIKTDFNNYPQIDMQNLYQVDYWTQRWKITIEQLTKAAKAVDSTIVSEVEGYLKKNRK